MLSADGIPFDYILDIFTHCPDVDETTFYFSGEEPGCQHYLGYLPQYTEAPYWAGYCDLTDGFDRATATELFHAPYYDGKSLSERWSEIHFSTIGMLSPEYFIKVHGDQFPIGAYFTDADRGQFCKELDCIKYEKVLDVYHQLCQSEGNEIASKLATEAITYFISLKRDSNMMQSPSDSVLETLWDEICVQVQYGYSYLWDFYDDFIGQYLENLIYQRCNETQRKLLWLCTEEAEDWNSSISFKAVDELLDGTFAAEADIANTVNYLKIVILRDAASCTNERIAAYSDSIW